MTVRWWVDLGDYTSALAVTSDGSLVAAGSLAGDAVLVDGESGVVVAKLAEHPMGVLCASWSPDESRLAIGGQDAIVRIYDRSGVEQGRVELSGWVNALAWQPVTVRSGLRSALAIGAGRTMTIVDDDGHVVSVGDAEASTVLDVAWSVDGSRAGAAAYGGIHWYDHTGDRSGKQRRFTWKGSLLSLAVSPDGNWVCAGAQDSSIHLWRCWSGKDLSMSGYAAKVEHLAFRRDSRWMAAACLGEVTVWDFGGRGPSGRAPASGQAHDRHIEALAWGGSGSRLATGCAAGRVAVWAAPSRAGQKLKPATVLEMEAGVSRLSWTPDDDIVLGRSDGVVLRHGFARP